VLADDEHRRDLAVALPRRDEPQDLELALGQPVARARPGRETRQIGRRSETVVLLPRRLELQRGRLFVPESRARTGNLLARTGNLVRRVELEPEALRFAQARKRR